MKAREIPWAKADAPLRRPGYLLEEKQQPKATKRPREKPKQGDALELEDPEPWPAAVNGARLLEEMRERFREYVVLPKHADVALPLWVLLAYTFNAFYVAPKLAITSPLKRCGKTQLLIVISALTPRALPVSNITASALFRTIQHFRPTLLIDEADTFLKNDDDDLRGIINSGHTRKTAIVIRNVGDDHQPRTFSTWCPQVIALIGKLSDTIADRSIEIRQQRRAPTETVARLRQDRIDDECLQLRRQAKRWANDHAAALREADPEIPDTLNDRARDCWRPLLAIADRAGGEWPELARAAARGLTDAATESTELAVELLRDIKMLLESAAGKVYTDERFVPSAWVRDELLKLDGRPWADFKDGRPISAKRIAALLAGFQIVPSSDRTCRGYRFEVFTDAFVRYLPDPGFEASTCHNTNNDGLKPEFSIRHDDPSVTH
jgi:putative DNA primase/helicase